VQVNKLAAKKHFPRAADPGAFQKTLNKVSASPSAFAIASALRPALEGRCDGEGARGGPSVEPERKSSRNRQRPSNNNHLIRKEFKNVFLNRLLTKIKTVALRFPSSKPYIGYSLSVGCYRKFPRRREQLQIRWPFRGADPKDLCSGSTAGGVLRFPLRGQLVWGAKLEV